MNYSPRFWAAVFGLFCFLLLSQAAFAQDFSSVDSDLQQLEDLINDTIASTEEQQKLLRGLRESLNESGALISNYESIISGQENLLTDLQVRLNEMSETYRMQSALSVKYEKSSRFWRIFTITAIPTAAIISGGITWAVMKR